MTMMIVLMMMMMMMMLMIEVMFYCFDRLVCLNRSVYTEPSSKCGSESDWREGGGREDYIKLSGPLGRK